MKRPSTPAKRLRRLVGTFVALVVLLGAGAVLTGRVGYVVTDGISMEPLYHTGDLVVIAPASSYHIGEIVAYRGDLDGHKVVLHRIVGGNATSGFIMKGDNNRSVDPTHPKASQVIGRAVLHIPKVGKLMTSPEIRALLALVIVVALVSLLVEPRRKPGVEPHGKPVRVPRAAPVPQAQAFFGAGVGRSVVSPLLRPSSAATWTGSARAVLPPSASGPWAGTVSPLRRSSGGSALNSPPVADGGRRAPTPAPAVMGSAPVHQHRSLAPWKIFAGLMVLVGIVLGMSLLASSPRPAPTPPTFTQTAALTYHASTPVTATYPTGRVVTGDPVFLKLVDRLGISYFYSSDAPASSVRGTVRLGAVVSGENGWQISLPLVKATPLKDGRLSLIASLDLARIEAIAAQVSQSTETYTGTLTVSVTALSKISFNGAAPVSSEVQLPLSLSAFELTMATGSTTQTAHGPAMTLTSPLNKATPPPQHSSPWHEVRIGLIGALLLLIAATVAAIPSSESEERREPRKG
jgi:signal peptidase I